MKRAVNQWCFPTGTSMEQVFRVASDAGLDGVELNIYEPGNVGLTLDSTESDAKAIKQLATDFGLELPSLSNGLLWTWPLSSNDVVTRTKSSQIVQKQLELASIMEMDTVLVVPGVVIAEVSYEECWKRGQDEIAKLANYAEKLGVRIGIENVWNRFLLSPVEMLRFIEEIQSPFVGAYFDVGNVLNYGFPEQWIRTIGKHILKVHVKDFLTRVGNINGFVPLLAGDVDWQSVRASLREIGYDDYITAEVSPYVCDANRVIYDTANQMSVIINM